MKTIKLIFFNNSNIRRWWWVIGWDVKVTVKQTKKEKGE